MIVILDNLRSALNVGSIIRTCDALGIKELYLCGITPGPENPKVKKTALGAEKNVNARNFDSTVEAINFARKKGNAIIALELTKKAKPVSTVDRSKGLALVLGNEISGVDSEVLNLSDQIVMIPMKGIKESLNVSVAFGIAAYETLNPEKHL